MTNDRLTVPTVRPTVELRNWTLVRVQPLAGCRKSDELQIEAVNRTLGILRQGTPKGVSIGAGPLAINIQPLRGCGPKLLFWHLISSTTSLGCVFATWRLNKA